MIVAGASMTGVIIAIVVWVSPDEDQNLVFYDSGSN
jgi:hypothetical protein